MLAARWYSLAVAALTVAFCALTALWALVGTPLSGPDEINHFNSVIRVAHGDGWPRPFDAKMYTITSEMTSEAKWVTGLSPLAPADRTHIPSGPLDLSTTRDWMVEHPPGYYYLAAGVYRLLGGDPRWDHALLALRLLSVVLVSISIPFLIGIVRRITGSRRAGLAGGAAVFFVPSFNVVAGTVNNDSLLLCLLPIALYCALRTGVGTPGFDTPPSAALNPATQPPVRDRSWWFVAASGLFLGLALFTKGIALFAIPLLAALIWMRAVRAGRGWRIGALRAFVALAVAFVIGGWWWLRNLIILGRLQPSVWGDMIPAPPKPPHPIDMGFFNHNFEIRVRTLFWGRLADKSINLPDVLTIILSVTLIVVIVIAFVVARSWVRVEFAVFLVFLLLLAITLWSNAQHVYHEFADPNRGVQGRYFFSGIEALALALGISVRWRAGRWSRRWLQRGVPSAVVSRRLNGGTALWVVGTAVYAIAVLLYYLHRSFPLRHFSTAHHDLSARWGVGLGWYIVLAIVVLAAVVAAALAISRRPSALTGSGQEADGEGSAAEGLEGLDRA